MYDKFLKRLEEIKEYAWNNYDIKIHEEAKGQHGVRKGETALQAIARNMVEAMTEEDYRDNLLPEEAEILSVLPEEKQESVFKSASKQTHCQNLQQWLSFLKDVVSVANRRK